MIGSCWSFRSLAVLAARAAVVVPRHPFEEALPSRPFRFGKGLRSFAGWWWFATTDRLAVTRHD